MLLDSWQEHDLLECATKAAPGNAGESLRQQHRKSIPIKNKPLKVQQPVAFSGITSHTVCGHFL
jgi:hypothetical protein